MNKILKFVGDWKELIPMGYKFKKLFARNYKVYHLQNPDSCVQDIWIWVKGRTVEFNSMNRYASLVIYKAMKNVSSDHFFWYRVNRKRYFVCHEDTLENNEMSRMVKLVKKEITICESSVLLDEFSRKYFQIDYDEFVRNEINKLIDLGLVIIGDEDKWIP